MRDERDERDERNGAALVSAARHRFTLSEVQQDWQFARCRGACTLWLWPEQKYRLTIGATHETVEGSRVFGVKRPSRVRVTPREDSPHGLETAGVILLGSGVVLVGLALNADTNDSGEGAGGMGFVGLVAIAAGAVLTIIGASVGPRTKPQLEIESR